MQLEWLDEVTILQREKKNTVVNPSLFSLYFHELGWLCSAIIGDCEAIFENTPILGKEHYIKVAPEIHARISSVLINAANIKKLVNSARTKFKNESIAIFELRQHRAETLRETLSGIRIEEMFDNKVRNSLEHFDEYLDEDILRLSKIENVKDPMAVYNMVLSHREVFSPSVYPIRLYIASERKFYNMHCSIDIGKLYDEACLILKRLKSSGVFPEEGPGGLMLKL